MPNFYETKQAGKRAEDLVAEVLQSYTKHVYRNVRVDTLYTKTGTTEIDIVAAVSDVLLVVEVKNVRSITGSIYDNFWELQGGERGDFYSSLNVFTQNRIHVRALKNIWFALRNEFPVVISVVVVPNNCVVPDDLKDSGILTVSEFSVQVAELCISNESTKYGYALDFLMRRCGGYLKRPDFVGGDV